MSDREAIERMTTLEEVVQAMFDEYMADECCDYLVLHRLIEQGHVLLSHRPPPAGQSVGLREENERLRDHRHHPLRPTIEAAVMNSPAIAGVNSTWLRAVASDVATDVLAALSSPAQEPPTAEGGWKPIETAPDTDHMRPVLAHWTGRGVQQTYWDVDDDHDQRPKSWHSPECGWRCDGDQCIPVNQEDVTHWRPLPDPPALSSGSLPLILGGDGSSQSQPVLASNGQTEAGDTASGDLS